MTKSKLAVTLVVAFFSVAPLLAQNQTATVSPILNIPGGPSGYLPYSISLTTDNTAGSGIPGLQGYVKANVGNDFLIIAGRTNGLHNFTNSGILNFPPDDQNTVVYVIDPATGQTWSRPLTSAASGLSRMQIDELSTTAPEYAQQGNSLFLVGGYGYNHTTKDFQTFDTLTSINLQQAVNWVQGGSGTLASDLSQTSSPLLQVTGGNLQIMNGRANLIFGINFTGGYFDPGSTEVYTRQVRSFNIVQNGSSVSLANPTESTPELDNNRRDLNVIPIMLNHGTEEGAVALSGVFTPGMGAWTVPVEISANGTTHEADPTLPSTFKQGWNGYNTASVSLYSASRDQSNIILMGGISFQYYDTQTKQIVSDPMLPFTNSMVSIVRSSDGSYQQYYLGELPSIPNKANGGAPFLFGAEAHVLPNESLSYLPNGQVDMDTLSASVPTFLGYFYGGIAAVQPNDGSSGASDLLFPVTYQPSPTIDLAGGNVTVGSLSGGNPTTISNSSPTPGVLSVGKGLSSTDSFAYSGLIEDGTGTVGLNLLAGSLEVTNSNTYSGGTTISGGTLIAGNNSAFGTGNMMVNNGTLVVGATPSGTLHIGGNYAQGAGGALALTISSPTVYNALSVGGTAQLGGTLVANFQGNYLPSVGQNFALIQATGGVTGQFASITVNTAFPTLGLSQNGGNFSVTQLPFAPYAQTPNQAAVARYIDAHDTGAITPGFASVVKGLNSSSGNRATLAGAFDQLSANNFGNFSRSTIFNNASFATQQFDSYVEGMRTPQGTFEAYDGHLNTSGLTMLSPNVDPGLAQVQGRLLAFNPTPLGAGLLSDAGDAVLGGVDMKNVAPGTIDTNPWDVFIQGNVILGQDFSQPGLPYNSSTTGGVQVGASYKFSPHWLGGVLFGYGHTNATLDTIGSNATVNSYLPGIFGSYADKGWYANALGTFGVNSFTENRAMNFGGFNGNATGAPSGLQEMANFDGGYDFHHQNWTFGPTLGLQYTHFNIDSFTESGSSGANLVVGSEESNSLRSRLGGHVSYDSSWGGVVFTPHLDASWQHECLDNSQGITSQFASVGAGSFTVDTPNPSRESALVDVGLNTQVNNQVSVFADYLVQVGQSNYFGQSVQAGVKIGF